MRALENRAINKTSAQNRDQTLKTAIVNFLASMLHARVLLMQVVKTITVHDILSEK